MFWRRKPMSEVDREITASIKALKTLTCVERRVSVSPSEVTSRPGYLASRAQAAALVSKSHGAHTRVTQSTEIDLVVLIAQSLLLSRKRGQSLDDAIGTLRASLKSAKW